MREEGSSVGGEAWRGGGFPEVSGQQLVGEQRSHGLPLGGPGWALGGLQGCILNASGPQADP